MSHESISQSETVFRILTKFKNILMSRKKDEWKIAMSMKIIGEKRPGTVISSNEVNDTTLFFVREKGCIKNSTPKKYRSKEKYQNYGKQKDLRSKSPKITIVQNFPTFRERKLTKHQTYLSGFHPQIFH